VKPRLRIGMVGSGFMGKAHAFGFALAERVFDLPYRIELACLADATEALARDAAAQLGFARATADWQALATDPGIDLVDVTAPNALHAPIALAALGAGKPVYCEKPLAPTAAEACAMAAAAAAAGVVTQVGFNYLANPMLGLAREMIEGGELGEIRSYRGIHAEDYMAEADTPWSFRLEREGGGAMADLGSHALATAEHLLGPIARVLGDAVTAVGARPGPHGAPRPSVVDDVSRAHLRFASGASGSLEASWIATGRKMQHDFEVYGARGALVFSQERLNELWVHEAAGPAGRRGFRRVEAGPAHAPYGRFCVAPGHQLGFNELKAIEIGRFLEALAGLRPEPFGFAAGARVQRLVEAVAASAAEGGWRDTLPGGEGRG
jgi:predicted dehydrogenase